MATQLEIRRRLEEQRKARERMQSAMSVPVDGLSATPYIMDSFKRSGGWPGQAVDPLFVNSPYTVRVEAESPSVTGFLFDRAEPTMLESDDPRIRAQREAELQTQRIESGDIPSLGDILIPNQEERLKQIDVARNFREYGEIPNEKSIRDSIAVSSESIVPPVDSLLEKSSPETTPIVPLPPVKPTPLVQQDSEISPPKEQVWGKYAQDPAARKKEYLDQLNKIYRNAMILNAIAQLTGGVSQADAYVQMATGKLDAIDKFDSEERMHNIWKEVFFVDGAYAPPGDWTTTYDKVIQLGGTPKEAEELASSMYKKPSGDAFKGGVATEQFEIWKAMPKGELKEAYGNLIGVNKGSDRGKITAYQAANLLKAYSDGSLEFDEAQLTALNSIMNTGLSGSVPTIEDSPSVPQQVESAGDSNLQAAKKRAAELQAQGKSREEIMSILRQEGLN